MTEQPITVDQIAPHLSERGVAEVRAAVAEYRLRVLQAQVAAATPEVDAGE